MDYKSMNRDEVIRSTAQHIRRVGELMIREALEIAQRAVHHDATKWSEQEWPLIEKSTPQLSSLTYGTEEYKEALSSIRPALDHHYANNSHHPEFHNQGVNDMTLLDLVEMLCDWKAATERHDDGDIKKSLQHNKERFAISDQLNKILENTCKKNGWI